MSNKKSKHKKLTPSISNTKNPENIELISVTPLNEEQGELIKAIEKSTFIFATGAAGTGKSYISMKMAVKFLLEKRVKKIILIRPAVTAGEDLGFLPGSLEDKILPFHIPLQEILQQHIGYADINKLFLDGKIETCAIAYMRGRTLDDCFVIVDEAQNVTIDQMKMIMTRVGKNCTMVLDGDTDQYDLRKGQSGLLDAVKRFEHIHLDKNVNKGDKGQFSIVELKEIVRNPLISIIVDYYKKEI